MNAASIAALAFLVQAGGVVFWWLLIYAAPASRRWFFPGGVLDSVLASFIVPDLAVLALGSAVAGWLGLSGRRIAQPVAWFTAGAAVYAAAFTMSWAARVDAPNASPVLMLTSALLSCVAAALVVPRSG